MSDFNQTKPCQCGKLMILHKLPIGLSNGVENTTFFEYWCNCGRTEKAGERIERPVTWSAELKAKWDAANQPTLPAGGINLG